MLEGPEEFGLCVTGMEAEINCPKPDTGTQFQTSGSSLTGFFCFFYGYCYFCATNLIEGTH